MTTSFDFSLRQRAQLLGDGVDDVLVGTHRALKNISEVANHWLQASLPGMNSSLNPDAQALADTVDAAVHVPQRLAGRVVDQLSYWANSGIASGLQYVALSQGGPSAAYAGFGVPRVSAQKPQPFEPEWQDGIDFYPEAAAVKSGAQALAACAKERAGPQDTRCAAGMAQTALTMLAVFGVPSLASGATAGALADANSLIKATKSSSTWSFGPEADTGLGFSVGLREPELSNVVYSKAAKGKAKGDAQAAGETGATPSRGRKDVEFTAPTRPAIERFKDFLTTKAAGLGTHRAGDLVADLESRFKDLSATQASQQMTAFAEEFMRLPVEKRSELINTWLTRRHETRR